MNYFEGEKIQVETTANTIKIGEKYEVILKIHSDYGFVDDAKLIINQQKGTNEKEVKMNYVITKDDMNIFSCKINFENVGVHYFCFKFVIDQITKWIKNDTNNKCAAITNEDIPYWSVTVYEKDFSVPEWAKGKIMYQIFPDRFYQSKNFLPEKMPNRITKAWGDMPNWECDKDEKINNNDYFMGNLKGIEEKLDYIETLGVEIIYLNPIFLSQSNHRYDTADYEVVDPYLGTNEDLKNLCDEAHKRGIKIIIDGVFNHTGNDSKYFNEFGTYNTVGAFQSSQSPYYNWYRKNNKGNFEYWWGFKNLPVCDANNPDWQKFIYGQGGVIDKWFSLGIDGLRLDVADELTDEFIENIRIAVKRNKPDGFIIGEVWDNAITKEGYGKQRKYLLGKGLDTVMNYPFTNAILKYVRFGKADCFIETLNEILTMYPKEAICSLMNSLSTHDITRAMSTLVAEGIQNNRANWVWDVPYSRDWQFKNEKLTEEKYNEAKQLMKIAITIQYFLPGNPCIYYGDEVGMYGYKDPFNRKCFPWDNIDYELYQFFVELGKIRKNLTFLKNAQISLIEANENTLIFERYSENYEESDKCKDKLYNRILIAINRTKNDFKIKIPEIYKNGKILLKNNATEGVISNYGIIIKKIGNN